MDPKKRKKLKKAVWKVSDSTEFLGLSAAEAAFIELKLGLARALRERRAARELTQTEAARLLGSSQSRFAKMEAADPTVSLDLLVRALLTLGASPRLLADVVGGSFAIGESPAPYDTKRAKTAAKKKSRKS